MGTKQYNLVLAKAMNGKMHKNITAIDMKNSTGQTCKKPTRTNMKMTQ